MGNFFGQHCNLRPYNCMDLHRNDHSNGLAWPYSNRKRLCNGERSPVVESVAFRADNHSRKFRINCPNDDERQRNSQLLCV